MAAPTTWWNRLTYVAVFLLFAAGGVAIVFWNLPEIRLNQRLQRDKIALATELDYLAQELTVCQFRVDQLEHNPKAIERLAREKLGFARPGETVVFFIPPRLTVTDFGTNAPRRAIR